MLVDAPCKGNGGLGLLFSITSLLLNIIQLLEEISWKTNAKALLKVSGKVTSKHDY